MTGPGSAKWAVGSRASGVAVALLIAASSVLVVRAGQHSGATFDEPFYVAKGLESWRSGGNRALMTAGTMPLPVDAATLPLYVWEQARGEPFHPVNDFARLLPVARLAALPFWWLLIASAALWGRALGGEWGMVFAAGFTAFEPNLLAHAALATTDVAACGTLLFAAYAFSAGRDAGPTRRVIAPGLCAAAALSAKASALAFGPILFAVVGLCHLPPGERFRRRGTARLRRDLTLIGSIAAAGMLAYVGCDWAAEPTFVAWAERLPESGSKPILQALARNLRVFPNGLEGLVQQVKHNSRGHGAYILGEYHPRAVWYYFPVALSAKLPAAILALLAATLVARPKSLATPAGWGALTLFAFSLTCRVQIGVRLVFPLVVMLMIGLAAAWPPTRLGVGVRLVALALVIAETLAAGAGRLPFANAFWGGPTHTRAILADSNCDWGQGLPELASWHDADMTDDTMPLYVWYYGGDPAILMHPFHVKMAHTWPDPTPERLTRETANGLVAVSLSLLDACPDRRPATVALCEWLKRQPAVGETGCFRVYRLRP